MPVSCKLAITVWCWVKPTVCYHIIREGFLHLPLAFDPSCYPGYSVIKTEIARNATAKVCVQAKQKLNPNFSCTHSEINWRTSREGKTCRDFYVAHLPVIKSLQRNCFSQTHPALSPSLPRPSSPHLQAGRGRPTAQPRTPNQPQPFSWVQRRWLAAERPAAASYVSRLVRRCRAGGGRQRVYKEGAAAAERGQSERCGRERAWEARRIPQPQPPFPAGDGSSRSVRPRWRRWPTPAMLCYVTRPDAVVMEVEVEAKANGEDCLNQVRGVPRGAGGGLPLFPTFFFPPPFHLGCGACRLPFLAALRPGDGYRLSPSLV